MNGGVRRLDRLGIGLVILAIGWTFLAGSEGDPGPVAAVFGGVAVAMMLGRAVGAVNRSLVPAAVVVAGGIVAFLFRDDLLSFAPLSGPFGYANAKGAFFMVVALAGLMLTLAARSPIVRGVGASVAAAAAVVPLRSHVTASVILLAGLPLPAMVVAATGRGAARGVVAVSGALLLLAVVVTVVLGASYSPAGALGIRARVDQALTHDRVGLWNDAIEIMADHPVTGVGAGRFRAFSPIAREEPSNRLFWAHNEFLQQGAELGVPGLMFVLLIFAWGFLRLFVSETPDAVTALAAVTLLAVGVQASIDYVLHTAAIPLVTAFLVAIGMLPSRPLRRVGPGQRDR